MLEMTKKEMLLKLATELMELKEEYWELMHAQDIAEEQGNQKEIERFKHWRSKKSARMNQTKKIGELLGINPLKIENLAFELTVEKERKQA